VPGNDGKYLPPAGACDELQYCKPVAVINNLFDFSWNLGNIAKIPIKQPRPSQYTLRRAPANDHLERKIVL
jgi:hypothetical protein